MTDTFFAELWAAAKQAGPFASLLLLAALWAVNQERKAAIKKYDLLMARFIALAGDATATMKDWRRVLLKDSSDERD
jgi:hypothetical protein